MTARWKRIGMLTMTVVAFATVVSLAQAELTEHGDLFVKFSGGIVPNALPRHSRAPISVSVEGTVKTLSGERPPALRQITIAINNGGRIDTHGLPVCHLGQVEPSSSREALARCSPALVGGGSYTAAVAFPEQFAFPSRGKILAFNAVVDGQRAILAHVYGVDPVPLTRITVFHIRESPGTFGIVLSGALPPSLNRYGYVKRIALSLHRNFIYRSRPRSYLSAPCGAPAVFPFARASMTFADGRTLASTLTRSCKVLEP
jgi:hypothetical protein